MLLDIANPSATMAATRRQFALSTPQGGGEFLPGQIAGMKKHRSAGVHSLSLTLPDVDAAAFRDQFLPSPC
jgi:hypothetical protein